MSPIVSAATLVDRTVRFVDARTGPKARERYQQAHLHGAVFADMEHHLSAHPADPADGGRHPLPAIETFARTLGVWGIRPDDDVVVYDEAGGANAAARAWWMFRAIGHMRVRVLDGGFAAAQRSGLPIDADQVQPIASAPYPHTEWLLPTVSIDAIDRIRTDREFALFDARSDARFRGLEEPFDPIAGHIPGAINVPLQNNLNADGTFKSPDALGALYRTALHGVAPDHAIASCGSGVTACHTLLAMEIAGLKGAALYVGSWSEWCRTDRPRGP